MARFVRLIILAAITGAGVACANLGNLQQIIQPPRFEQAAGQPAEIRLLGPGANSPVGGAGVRIWLAVTNPKSVWVHAEHTQHDAYARRQSRRDRRLVPLDLSISFADVPGLSRTLGLLAVGGTAAYQLDGTIGIDAGRFGAPTFGPMRLSTGEL